MRKDQREGPIAGQTDEWILKFDHPIRSCQVRSRVLDGKGQCERVQWHWLKVNWAGSNPFRGDSLKRGVNQSKAEARQNEF
jgi:hypothetical protein